MAAVTCYGLAGVGQVPVPAGVYTNAFGVAILAPNFIPPVMARAGDSSWSALTVNTPIQEVVNSIGAVKAPSFLDDYYYRLHVRPNLIELGNLLSAQVRSVEVWNAYFTPDSLDAIVQTGTDGIAMAEPFPPPTVFAALESRVYTFTVSTNGPPIINASYLFNFASGFDPTLTITGRRVVLWPFVPDTGHEEVMEWKTDIIPSFNNEQRIAVRNAPRQSFSHDFWLDEAQFSRAKAMATQWAHRVFGIAVWAEATPLLNGLALGSTFIPFDTSNADYRNNDLVLLWASDTQLVALEISTVTPTGVNLKLPLEAAWPRCYVAPLRFARTLSGIDFKRSHNQYIAASATFSVTQNTDLGNEGSFPLYRGKPVMTDRSAVIGSLSERIVRTVDLFDNGSGPVELDIKNNWVRNAQTLSFTKRTRADIWNLRRWIHARRGRQRAFWLPSWNRDLTLLADVGSAAGAITVTPIGYPLYYTVKDFMVQLRSGTQLFGRVNFGQVDVNGNEQLTLQAPLGVAFTPADVDFICFLSHVRFDSDKIAFRHLEGGNINMTVSLAETPEL